METINLDTEKIIGFMEKVVDLGGKEGVNPQEFLVAVVRFAKLCLELQTKQTNIKVAKSLMAVAETLHDMKGLEKSMAKIDLMDELIQDADTTPKPDFQISRTSDGKVHVCSSLEEKEVKSRVHLKYSGIWKIHEKLECGDKPETHTHYIFRKGIK